jgi:flagellar protein FlaG
MRVERIQPELRPVEGTITSKEQGKVLEPFMTPTSRVVQDEENKAKQAPNLAEKLEDKVEQLNKTVEIFDRRIHFQIHEETNRIMVQVVEVETEEVLTEIPPEKILDLVARIEEMIGLIVDKKV